MRVLVTGGAGFIGSHLVDGLISDGHSVVIYDSLDPQVHPGGFLPEYLNPAAEFIVGTVTDRAKLKAYVQGADVIYHLAASVGVAQSQYQIARYADSIIRGTATLLDILANEKCNVQKLIALSSMTCYGEGNYHCVGCGEVRPNLRTGSEIEKYGWEPVCPICDGKISSIGIREKADLFTNSIYAVCKKAHEELIIGTAKLYELQTTIFRCFDVYGPRQYFGNPHAGVVAIFSGRILKGEDIIIFEDGNQTRDFIFVSDVVDILKQAGGDNQDKLVRILNVGSGVGISIKEIAEKLIEISGKNIKLKFTKQFRKGDIRNCDADTRQLSNLMDGMRLTELESGLRTTFEWARSQKTGVFGDFDKSIEDLKSRGLITS